MWEEKASADADNLGHNIYIFYKKEKRFQINNPILHLKEQEREQTKPKSRGRKKIIKIRGEISKIENR